MNKLEELTEYLGEVIEEMEAIYNLKPSLNTYLITYVDNRGEAKSFDAEAMSFGEAVTLAEDNANEVGHGFGWLSKGVRRGK